VAAKDTALWHHFDDLSHQQEANTLGMWVFLATELLIFGALFTGYTVYRANYPGAFEEASSRLNVLIAGVNTLVLLTSSLTMVLSVWAVQAGRRQMLVVCLVLTALLGLTFMVLKVVEYAGDYRDRLVPVLAFDPGDWRHNPAHVQLFLVFYYVMTGLHAVHLLVGIAIVAFLAAMAWRGAYGPAYYAPVEMWGLYWHFVDVVWIFLLPLLYLIGRHSLSDYW
jgi:cytochrome c oxidase subunit 3